MLKAQEVFDFTAAAKPPRQTSPENNLFLVPEEEEWNPTIPGVDGEGLAGWQRELFRAWQDLEKAIVGGLEGSNPRFDTTSFIRRCREAQEVAQVLVKAFPDNRLATALEKAVRDGDRAKLTSCVRTALSGETK